MTAKSRQRKLQRKQKNKPALTKFMFPLDEGKHVFITAEDQKQAQAIYDNFYKETNS